MVAVGSSEINGVSTSVRHIAGLHPPLVLKRKMYQTEKPLHATTPALMRLPATGRLSAITHVATFVHDIQIDLRMFGTSNI